MPFPKEFYYTKSSSGKRYVRDPTGSSGIWDLDRLRAGLAAWEDYTLKRITKPRKLILLDSTILVNPSTKSIGPQL